MLAGIGSYKKMKTGPTTVFRVFCGKILAEVNKGMLSFTTNALLQLWLTLTS
jgi:hypothetical protein